MLQSLALNARGCSASAQALEGPQPIGMSCARIPPQARVAHGRRASKQARSPAMRMRKPARSGAVSLVHSRARDMMRVLHMPCPVAPEGACS